MVLQHADEKAQVEMFNKVSEIMKKKSSIPMDFVKWKKKNNDTVFSAAQASFGLVTVLTGAYAHYHRGDIPWAVIFFSLAVAVVCLCIENAYAALQLSFDLELKVLRERDRDVGRQVRQLLVNCAVAGVEPTGHALSVIEMLRKPTVGRVSQRSHYLALAGIFVLSLFSAALVMIMLCFRHAAP